MEKEAIDYLEDAAFRFADANNSFSMGELLGATKDQVANIKAGYQHTMRRELNLYCDQAQKVCAKYRPNQYGNLMERAIATDASPRMKEMVQWLLDGKCVCPFAKISAEKDRIAWCEPTDIENLEALQAMLQKCMLEFLAIGRYGNMIIADPNLSDEKESIRQSGKIILRELGVAAEVIESMLRGKTMDVSEVEMAREIVESLQKRSYVKGFTIFDMDVFSFYMGRGYGNENTENGKAHPRLGDNIVVCTWNGDILTAPEEAQQEIARRCREILGYNMDGGAFVF